MSCLNPMLMLTCDFSPLCKGLSTLQISDRLSRYTDKGWKLNPDTLIGYRIVSKESRQFVLESIPDWLTQKVIEVPCGNCLQCRLDYSKDWANRCSLEAEQYEHNWFVTLSYDDDHLPKGPYDNGIVVRKHVQQFIKSLRLKFSRLGFQGLRYFGASEYGDRTMRPHYHIILFNCPLNDVTTDFIQPDGSVIHLRNPLTGGWYKFSQFIKDVWPYGNIVIDDCNWNTQAYVSRYILKKQKGKGAKAYDALGLQYPFVFMSNKPGIGSQYLKDHKHELIRHPRIIVPRPYKEPMITGLPRYFKKVIKRDAPEFYQEMVDKAKENIAKARTLVKGPMNRQRSIQESNSLARAKAFERDF